jgi:hypothetical protein
MLAEPLSQNLAVTNMLSIVWYEFFFHSLIFFIKSTRENVSKDYFDKKIYVEYSSGPFLVETNEKTC